MNLIVPGFTTWVDERMQPSVLTAVLSHLGSVRLQLHSRLSVVQWGHEQLQLFEGAAVASHLVGLVLHHVAEVLQLLVACLALLVAGLKHKPFIHSMQWKWPASPLSKMYQFFLQAILDEYGARTL